MKQVTAIFLAGAVMVAAPAAADEVLPFEVFQPIGDLGIAPVTNDPLPFEVFQPIGDLGIKPVSNEPLPFEVFQPIGDLGITPTAAVPEPATWALLIAGFGLVGYSARRRRFRLGRSAG